MKPYFYILFLGLIFIAPRALPAELYETTPVKINFDLNGEIYTYETNMGSAFAAADTVIIGDDLYVKYPRSKPAQYIALGKVKRNEDGSYTWIQEGNQKLSFSFTCDVDTTTIECISFDASKKDLAPYKKSWKEVWDLEKPDPELKAMVEDIIQTMDTPPQINSTCEEQKEKSSPEN